MTKAYEYCKKSITAKTTPRYVKKQMRQFMRIEDGKDKKYILDLAKYQQIESVLKLLIMPRGLKRGKLFTSARPGISG